MTKINFHIHSTGSDGRSTPEEVVKHAIEKKFDFICFTDHYFFPEKLKEINGPHHPIYLKELARIKEWRKHFHNKDYVKEIRNLQKKYAREIDISFGTEVDWLQYDNEWIKKETNKEKYDYILGSLHSVSLKGVYWPIELGKNGKDAWKSTADERFGSVKNLVMGYYNDLRLLANSKLFDGIAHFDLIKMYNADSSLFSEKESWYKNEVLSVLDEIKKNDLVIEINTRGKIKTTASFYPSLWILKEAKKRNIPITIGTDAHHAHEIDLEYENAIDFAKEAGYTELCRFKNRKRINVPLE